MQRDFIRIKVDKDVKVALLLSVINEVKLPGIKNLSIMTEMGMHNE